METEKLYEIFQYVLVAIIGLVVFYLVVKEAVRNGIISAKKKLKD